MTSTSTDGPAWIDGPVPCTCGMTVALCPYLCRSDVLANGCPYQQGDDADD